MRYGGETGRAQTSRTEIPLAYLCLVCGVSNGELVDHSRNSKRHFTWNRDVILKSEGGPVPGTDVTSLSDSQGGIGDGNTTP